MCYVLALCFQFMILCTHVMTSTLPYQLKPQYLLREVSKIDINCFHSDLLTIYTIAFVHHLQIIFSDILQVICNIVVQCICVWLKHVYVYASIYTGIRVHTYPVVCTCMHIISRKIGFAFVAFKDNSVYM